MAEESLDESIAEIVQSRNEHLLKAEKLKHELPLNNGQGIHQCIALHLKFAEQDSATLADIKRQKQAA